MRDSAIAERLSLWVFSGLMVAAALIDLTTYRIPNWLPLSICVAFAVSAIVLRTPFKHIGGHVLCGLLMLAVGMVAFAFELAGGGDGKLLAAAALWLGWPALKRFVPATLAAWAVLMLVIVGLRSDAVQANLPQFTGWMGRLLAPGDLVPLAPAIACGALFSLPATRIFQAVKRARLQRP